ncbi:MAG: ribose 5-phosphate isomerase B [Chitinivibrionales bacterium]|nr:ribose 5-phosphate isomerase B [Chitinivibrionales bacterium]MBD3396202.1 ribose 5-phosphate isomerase B [Chitinivibrionales bacterium]
MPDTAIIIGSDHAGYEMKEHIKAELAAKGIPFEDIGTYDTTSTDYPLWAGRVAKAVSHGTREKGIAICGSGIGASMAANRFRGVRAALCITPEMARLSREHNNANVLVLGGRITTPETATEILWTWLDTAFEGGRHERRIAQIDEVAEEGGSKQ